MNNWRNHYREEEYRQRRTEYRNINIADIRNMIHCLHYPADNLPMGKIARTAKVQEEYIQNIASFIRKECLSDHIIIEENPGDILLGRAKKPFCSKYKIRIQHLNIIVPDGRSLICCARLDDAQIFPPAVKAIHYRHNNKGCYIAFDKNNFILEKPHSHPQTITLNLMSESYLHFESNYFQNVNLDFSINASENTFLTLNNNEFAQADLCLDVHFIEGFNGMEGFENSAGTKGFMMDSGDSSQPWEVTSRRLADNWGSKKLEEIVNRAWNASNYKEIYDLIDKIKSDGKTNAEDLLRFIYYSSQQIKVQSSDLKPRQNQSHIILKDNTISNIIATIPLSASFEGKNIVKGIFHGPLEDKQPVFKSYKYEHDLGFDTYWGRYNQVDTDGEHPHANIEFFLHLKDKAIAKQDKSQEAIVSREIIKCEHHIIKREKGIESLQDQIILAFGKYVSDHGSSIVRPVIAAFIINFLILLGILLLEITPAKGLTLFNVFWEMFNPVSNLSTNLSSKSSWTSLLNILQKICLALFTYELIRVGRKFTAR